MKNIILSIQFLVLSLVITLTGCEETLEEDVFFQIAQKDFYKTDQEAIQASNAIYVKLRADGRAVGSGEEGNRQQQSWGMLAFGEASYFNLMEVNTDELFVKWASFGGFWQALEDFNLVPAGGFQFNQMYENIYEGIMIANLTMERVNASEGVSPALKNLITGESLFLRGLFYSFGYSLYENIPLVLDVNTNAVIKQAEPDSIVAQVVRDLTRAAELLPERREEGEYGKFTKGMALSWLARFQLNQKNWSEAARLSLEVMNSGVYQFSDSYQDIFSVDNFNNSEVIFPIQCLAEAGIGNTFVAHTSEPNYVSGSWGGHLAREDFYNSFEDGDIRKSLLIKEYQNGAGEDFTIPDGAMIMKYEVDSNRVGPSAGNDIVLHRYSEVLMTRAEALNELNGPNQESIDLINQIRMRAFTNDATKNLNISDFTKETLRDHILKERGWEFYAESYRRDDLLRHDKFISSAVSRGKNAQDFHVRYPIPLNAIDRNLNLDQNDGYDD